jgi:hypothetical protein
MVDPVILQQLLAEIATLSKWTIGAAAIAAVAVASLVAGALWFQREYHRERGKIKGQLDSIGELRTLIEAQTKVVKKIESEFDYSTWHAKERNQMLRMKLEELLRSALLDHSHAERMRNYLVFNDPEPTAPQSQGTFLALQTLYFPELAAGSITFSTALGVFLNGCRQAYLHRIEDHQAAVAAGTLPVTSDWRTLTPPREADNGNVQQLKIALYVALVALREVCGARMVQLLAQEGGGPINQAAGIATGAQPQP